MAVPALLFAAPLTLRTDAGSGPPQARILSHNDRKVDLEVRLPGLELLTGELEGKIWDRVEIPGGGYDQEIGQPEVP
ncbi:MAG: hypothetical protein C4524_00215, partial [Candidatus Zixiibacteriota bacterium]